MRWSAAVCLVALCAMPRVAAAEPPADAPATRPKVALVVSGDPDPALVSSASAVRDALGDEPGLLLPSDAELAAALAGAPAPDVDDGLADVRALRRRLGISPARDAEVLARLGRITGAVAVVVVARAPEPTLEVFDVGRRSHFADALPLAGAEPAAIRRFVLRRAAAALAHAGEAPAVASGAAPAVDDAAETPRAPAAPEREPSERRRSIRRTIGYVAAGALLVGLGAFLIVDLTKDDPAPIVRIRPGGG